MLQETSKKPACVRRMGRPFAPAVLLALATACGEGGASKQADVEDVVPPCVGPEAETSFEASDGWCFDEEAGYYLNGVERWAYDPESGLVYLSEEDVYYLVDSGWFYLPQDGLFVQPEEELYYDARTELLFLAQEGVYYQPSTDTYFDPGTNLFYAASEGLIVDATTGDVYEVAGGLGDLAGAARRIPARDGEKQLTLNQEILGNLLGATNAISADPFGGILDPTTQEALAGVGFTGTAPGTINPINNTTSLINSYFGALNDPTRLAAVYSSSQVAAGQAAQQDVYNEVFVNMLGGAGADAASEIGSGATFVSTLRLDPEGAIRGRVR